MGLKIVKKNKSNLTVQLRYGFVCADSMAIKYNLKEKQNGKYR